MKSFAGYAIEQEVAREARGERAEHHRERDDAETEEPHTRASKALHPTTRWPRLEHVGGVGWHHVTRHGRGA